MTPPSPFKAHLFGPLRVAVRGVPLPPVRTRSVEWLLALLLLRHGHAVERAWLAGMLWPDTEESRALQNLRNLLVSLRKALGPEAERLQTPAQGMLTLDLAGAEVDVAQFDGWIAAGEEAGLRQAVAVYRGPLLEGCAEEWVLAEREARAEQCLGALEKLAAGAEGRGEHGEAIRYLRQAEGMDPLRDSLQRRLMASLAAAGDAAAPIQVYRDFRSRLQEEMAAVPEAATTRLFQEIRSRCRGGSATEGGRERGRERGGDQDASLSPSPSLPRSVPALPRPLPHPLNPLIGREREVAEILERLEQGPLVTLIGGGGVGKTRLALEVAARAGEGLPGGAVWVDLAPLADSALVLSSVADAFGIREEGVRGLETLQARLAAWIAACPPLLVLDNCEHVLPAVTGLVQTLLQECAELRVLATSRQRLSLAGERAWRVPPLPVPSPGEWVMVDGQWFPAARLFVERASAARPGVRLEGAADAAAVGHICRRLDGIPLAIELAAARVSVLSVEQIAAGLDDRFQLLAKGGRAALPRHQTLRALIDWSYDHLSDAEAALLRRLSVFAGGWTLEAAENVCDFGFWILDFGQGSDGDPQRDDALTPDDRKWPSDAPIHNPQSTIQNPEVLDLLDALEDRSLILVEALAEGMRYRMLETVRAYAREKLRESGEEEAARQRHVAWSLLLAEQLREELYGPRHEVALAQLEAELDNFRTALEWCCSEGGQPSSGLQAHLRLVSALWPFWLLRGHLSEGREHLRQALRAEPAAASPARAQALLGAGTLASEQSEPAAARAYAEECLALYRARDDARGVADALLCLGTAARLAHDADAAAYLEESLQICRRIGHPHGLVAVLARLGRNLMMANQLAASRPLFEECLTTARALGDDNSVAQSLYHLGALARFERDFARSLELLGQSREIFQRLGRLQGVATALEEIALVHEARDDLDQALACHHDCMAMWRRLGNRSKVAWEVCMIANVAYRLGDVEAARLRFLEGRQLAREAQSRSTVAFACNSLGVMAFDQGEPGRAQALHREALAIYRDLDLRRGIAWSLGRLGMAEALVGDLRVAARLIGAMAALRGEVGLASTRTAPSEMDRLIDSLKAKLGAQAWDAAWHEGYAMSQEQAIADALGDAGAHPEAS